MVVLFRRDWESRELARRNAILKLWRKNWNDYLVITLSSNREEIQPVKEISAQWNVVNVEYKMRAKAVGVPIDASCDKPIVLQPQHFCQTTPIHIKSRRNRNILPKIIMAQDPRVLLQKVSSFHPFFSPPSRLARQ